MSAITTCAKSGCGCGCGKRVEIMCGSGDGLLEGVRWVLDLGVEGELLSHCDIPEARCTPVVHGSQNGSPGARQITLRQCLWERNGPRRKTKCLYGLEVWMEL